MLLDAWTLEAVQTLRTPMRTSVMFFFTGWGGWVGSTIVVALALTYLIHKRHWRCLWFFMVSVSGAAFFSYLLKFIFLRARPPAALALAFEPSFSFPSGHAATAIALYGALAILLWNTKLRRSVLLSCFLVFLLFCLAIGLSRLYLGVHWLTDVFGGYLFGALWLWVSYRLFGSRL